MAYIYVLITVFDSFDDDFDGIIKTEYLGDALRAMGVILSKDEITKLIDTIDKDKTNILTMGTFFVQLARAKRDGSEREQLCLSALGKLYVDPRLVKNKDDIDPTETFVPNIPLSSLQAVLTTAQIGEPLTEKEMDLFTTSITKAKLVDNGNIEIKKLWAFLMTPAADMAKEMEFYHSKHRPSS